MYPLPVTALSNSPPHKHRNTLKMREQAIFQGFKVMKCYSVALKINVHPLAGAQPLCHMTPILSTPQALARLWAHRGTCTPGCAVFSHAVSSVHTIPTICNALPSSSVLYSRYHLITQNSQLKYNFAKFPLAPGASFFIHTKASCTYFHYWLTITFLGGLPRWASGWDFAFQGRGCGFDPWSGN